MDEHLCNSPRYTFRKEERLVSRKRIDDLFSGGHSFVSHPIRAIYNPLRRPTFEPPVQLLISVSKRHFKHAVDRNRVKRQIREAYRHHKQKLYDAIAPEKQLIMAFVWLSDTHLPTNKIEDRINTLISKITERIIKEEEPK